MFSVYRDMGPVRSLRKVVEMTGKTPAYRQWLERWSAHWRWPERAAMFDDALDMQARERYAAEVRRMSERHAEIAKDAVEVVTRRLDTWLRRSRPPAMTASETARLLDVAVKVERLSRGEP